MFFLKRGLRSLTRRNYCTRTRPATRTKGGSLVLNTPDSVRTATACMQCVQSLVHAVDDARLMVSPLRA